MKPYTKIHESHVVRVVYKHIDKVRYLRRVASLTLVFAVASVTLLAQDCVNNLLLKTNSLCEKPLGLNSIWFLRPKRLSVDNDFRKDQILNAVYVSDCRALRDIRYRVDQSDTIFHFADSYIDFFYRDSYADSVYNDLVKNTVHRKAYRTVERLWRFFKPGKIILLDRARSRIRVVDFNFCANYNLYVKTMDCLKKDKGGFDKILYAGCGGETFYEW